MNARAIACTAALLFVGCGGAAPKSTTTPTNESKGVEETTTTTGGSVPSEKEIVTPDAAQQQLDEAQQSFDAASGDCARMCKALSSMQRAVDHLCNLASDDDGKKKCDDARARESSAEAKVKAACGGCG